MDIPQVVPFFKDDRVVLYGGDCRVVLRALPADSIDSVICDPPYELTFMGRSWDATGVAFDPQTWREVWRVMKPGAHLLAFGGTRTWHRMVCAAEDAGFEIRDSIAWLYSQGMPKSWDVAKAIDKLAGVEFERRTPDGVGFMRPDGGQGWNPTKVHLARVGESCDDGKKWAGWSTSLKPSFEPIMVARKPLMGTVAANVLEHGTGALNIDACRVGTGEDSQGARSSSEPSSTRRYTDAGAVSLAATPGPRGGSPAGRWPPNVVLDEQQAEDLDQQSGYLPPGGSLRGAGPRNNNVFGQDAAARGDWDAYGDEGGASRFFPTFRYSAKAPSRERPSVDGVQHATVKPVDLMRWLVRLVTPVGGTVLDPFGGSGTTGEAAIHEHKNAILVELEESYLPLIVARLSKPMEVGFDFGA